MYISKITLKNFRNFNDTEIEFNDGVNVIIGHNNSGKTNLLKSLSLIFDNSTSKRLTVDDFNQSISDFNNPPRIDISATMRQSEKPENENKEDQNTVSTWLLDINPPYEAMLTYSFFLPDRELEDYEKEIEKLSKSNPTSKDYWRMIKRKFIRKYVSRLYGGQLEFNNRAESEKLDRFDFQFLEPIRDVERTMFTGRNPMLKEILDYFLDDDIARDDNLDEDKKQAEIDIREAQFFKDSKTVIDSLEKRVDVDAILKYSTYTGASFGGNPIFEGEISESELLSSLKLLIEKKTGLTIPATHNGLGYNNLIYIALVLAKMQMDCSSYIGAENAKVFPMLIIEEPEAHLHPAMQFKLLKFLKENINREKQVRQLFITTHSTHITAAVSLDEIICMYVNDTDSLCVAYPGNVFDITKDEDKKSKAYVERFLDATKSDMLFSDKVILVEGLAEQLLLNCFSEYEKKSLVDSHISVVNIGGRYFEHFLKLFDFDEKDSYKKHAINKKVACVVDSDPTRLEDTKWKKCFPFEIKDDKNHKGIADNVNSLKTGKSPNISVFCNESGKGKTLEYDIAFENPDCRLIITDSIIPKNRKILEQLMDKYSTEDINSIKETPNVDTAICNLLEESCWNEDDKKKAIIAFHYFMAVSNAKGEHAMQVEYNLSKNMETEKPTSFNVPTNFSEAMTWIDG
jgi:putative ATP-dependent endonuclease of the OLD family